MALPDLSNSMYVARLRYIQTIHESAEYCNPDTLVRHFIPIRDRLKTAWLRRDELSRLRADPFYYYVVARTKYYDQVISDAVADGVGQIVGIGCGSDTRAYRFNSLLCSKGVRVLECDQPQAILEKRRMVKSLRPADHIEYLPIDLNDGEWPDFKRWLGQRKHAKTLVMMEGVSPYVDQDNFDGFLQLLATELAPWSQFAYDFKLLRVNDEFGREGRTRKPFRLSNVRQEVADYHQHRGFRLDYMELSSELTVRLLPSLAGSAGPLFAEDGLIRLTVNPS